MRAPRKHARLYSQVRLCVCVARAPPVRPCAGCRTSASSLGGCAGTATSLLTVGLETLNPALSVTPWVCLGVCSGFRLKLKLRRSLSCGALPHLFCVRVCVRVCVCPEESRRLLFSCLWSLYSEEPADAVERKANQWIQVRASGNHIQPASVSLISTALISIKSSSI